MKKTGILHKDISELVAAIGHTDSIIICDAGFPIPSGVKRIDLGVEENLPTTLDLIRVILKELPVEKIIVAKETEEVSPERYDEMVSFFPGVERKLIPHIDFKEISKNAKAVIKTGDCTPYSNIILIAGVPY
ncbi:D-ribose pyranase [Clostridium malenominatum]|uniref:D-ribose pyranase n=1 Tax=Clostridium malenominatum TaxID=1539 RepID=A0ABP3TW77_9CLOT